MKKQIPLLQRKNLVRCLVLPWNTNQDYLKCVDRKREELVILEMLLTISITVNCSPFYMARSSLNSPVIPLSPFSSASRHVPVFGASRLGLSLCCSGLFPLSALIKIMSLKILSVEYLHTSFSYSVLFLICIICSNCILLFYARSLRNHNGHSVNFFFFSA